MLVTVLALLFYLVRLARRASLRPLHFYRRIASPTDTVYRHRRKPEWVRQEVIRLKALMREAGTCRAIEQIFNRRFAVRRGMTVGRTWVSEVIRAHRHEIIFLSREIKNAKPKSVPKNLI